MDNREVIADGSDAGGRIEQVLEIVADCIQRRAAGEDLSDESLIEAHSELMPELGEHLRRLKLVQEARIEGARSDSLESTQIIDPIDKQFGDLTKAFDFDTPLNQESYLLSSPASASGEVIRYQIQEPLAQGGLGIVSRALDTQLNRDVALKEIKSKFADLPEIQTRFLLEAEITGGLEHPGIVPVYGLGRYADGRPFYAMRLIRGENLKQALVRFHETASASPPSSETTLALRKLLGCFISVCHTIAYAHSRGVLHRDIKPANIMLGKYNETLVVDWGLAKSLGPDETTGSRDGNESALMPTSGGGSSGTLDGSTVGTPSYMSPEQAGGRTQDLRPTCDVYSLGVTLYHLLTNQLAFASKENEDVEELLERVRSGDFPHPRSVHPQTPIRLEAICLKAMSLRPKDRYESATRMAQDLECYLADEPVVAYQENVWQRAGRFLRRHRSWVAAGGLALTLVTIVSVTAAVLVSEQRNRATEAAKESEKQRQRAVTHFRQSNDAVNLWLTGASSALQFYPGVQQVRLQLLKQAAQDLEQFAAQQSDDPEIEIERARAYLRLGDVRGMLGQFDRADQDYQRAETLLRRLLQHNPKMIDAALELANTWTKQGLAFADSGNNKQAEERYEQAIKELGKLRLRQPKHVGVRFALATAQLNRGVLIHKTGNFKKTQQAYRLAAFEYESLVEMESSENEPRHVSALATVRVLLGRILIERGKLDLGLAEYDRAIKAFAGLVSEEPDNPTYLEQLASSQVEQAEVLHLMGREGAERDAYMSAIESYVDLNKALPNVPLFLENRATARANLAMMLLRLGDAPGAEKELMLAMADFTQLAQDYFGVVGYLEKWATTRNMLGRALSDMGRNDDAKTALTEANTVFDNLIADEPNTIVYQYRRAAVHGHLARLSHKRGDEKQAKEHFDNSLKTLGEVVKQFPEIPAYADGLAQVHVDFGTYLWDLSDVPSAKIEFNKAAAIWRGLAANESAAETRYHLLQFLVECIDPQSRNSAEAVEIAQSLVDNNRANATYRGTLGAAFYRAGKSTEAVANLKEAEKIRQGTNARDGFFMAMSLWQLDQKQDARSRFDGAILWMDEHQKDNEELKRLRSEAEKLLGKSQLSEDSP